MVHKVSEYLSKQLGSTVKVDSVDIKFIRTVEITNVYLSTQKGPKDTLLYVHKMETGLMLGRTLLDQIGSLRDGKIYIDDVGLHGVVFKGHRGPDDSLFNFQFLLDQFASKQPAKPKPKNKNSKPLVFKLNEVELTHARLTLDDQYKDQRFDISYDRIFADIRELNFSPMKIDVKELALDRPDFRLTQYHLKEKEKDTTPSNGFNVQGIGKSLDLKVDLLTIKNGRHSMDMQRRDIHAGDFQISAMDIRQIEGRFENYRWDSTGMHINLKGLSANAANKMELKKLAGDILLDNGGIYLDNADLAYNNTFLKGDLSLQFQDEWRSFGQFSEEVMMKADIKSATAYAEDIAVFAPSVKKYIPQKLSLKGFIKGRLANIRVQELLVQGGNNTAIDITGNIKGLPKVKQTLFDLKINRLQTSVSDIQQMMPFVKVPKQIKNAGTIQFKGDFFGFTNDFVSKGNLTTGNLGSVAMDIRMNFPKGQPGNYSGKVSGNNINLAEITGNSKLFGRADLDITANGKGFSSKDIQTNISGIVRDFYFNGYVFNSIKVDGQVDKKKFSGKAFFDDSCFLVDFSGIADFNGPLPKYDFVTSIKNAELHKLNLTKDTLTISLNGAVHGEGNKIDNLTGNGTFSNIIIQNKKDMLALSDVAINLNNDGVIKDYVITSDQFNANLTGQFDPLTIVPSMKVFLSKYSKLIKPTEKDLKAARPQQLVANIKLKSDIGLFKVFVPKLQYISELDLKSDINTQTNKFDLTAKMDSANYDDIALNKISVAGNTGDKDILLHGNILRLQKGKTTVSDINLGVNSSLEQLLTKITVSSDTASNALRLLTTLDFNKDTIRAKILESTIKLNDKVWTVPENNQVTVIDSIFITQNFSLVQGDQQINIQNGRNTLSDAKINISQLDLADIGQLIDTSGAIRSGKLSGTVNLKNILTKLQANADVTIRDLQVLDYKVSYIGLDGIYGRNGKKILEAGGTIEDDNYQLSFDGIYDMQVKGKEKLDVNADIEKLNLNFLEAILKKELLVPRAFVKGQVNVSGNLKKPILTGVAQVIDTAELKMRYLGTTFKMVNEEIKLTSKGFDFGEITLYDNYGNTALLTGKLLHNGFKDFKVEKANLSAPAGYHFMNTTYEDNQDFYGKVFARGEVDIDGYFNDLYINVNRMETMKNTEFNLPVTDKASDKGYSFVTFVDPNDTIKKIEYKTKISGINLNMNITATPDAVANIILDPSSNDKIVGRGEGNLNLIINKKGEIGLYGTYFLTEGKYDFNFQGILNKTFTIGKDSKIEFNGDPLKAELSVNALYNVKAASVRNLFDSSYSIRNRSFPIDLKLNISGPLDKTSIGFNIEPNGVQPDDLMRKLTEINSSPTEVNNQAGFLLLFNAFLPTGASDQKVSGFSNTVTQLLSDQISKILSQGLSQLIKGSSLDVLLSDLDSPDSRNFGFSYKQELLGNRLILTIGGNVNFGNTSPTASGITSGQPANNAAVAGDFVLEYLVTADGRIRLKTYARTANYDIINQDRIRTGGAISFQKEFDNIKDLFRRKSKKEKAKTEANPAAAPPPEMEKNIEFSAPAN